MEDIQLFCRWHVILLEDIQVQCAKPLYFSKILRFVATPREGLRGFFGAK